MGEVYLKFLFRNFDYDLIIAWWCLLVVNAIFCSLEEYSSFSIRKAEAHRI